MIGAMAMPADFQYKEVFLKGYPHHDSSDSFRLKHPCMKPGRRAKLFNPFDALKGFSEAVEEKEIVYVPRQILSEGEKEKLDHKLRILQELTCNSKEARENHISVSITRFIPCLDKDSPAYGSRGQYVTVNGVVQKVCKSCLLLDNQQIPFTDIVNIESTVFEDIYEKWEEPA